MLLAHTVDLVSIYLDLLPGISTFSAILNKYLVVDFCLSTLELAKFVFYFVYFIDKLCVL